MIHRFKTIALLVCQPGMMHSPAPPFMVQEQSHSCPAAAASSALMYSLTAEPVLPDSTDMKSSLHLLRFTMTSSQCSSHRQPCHLSLDDPLNCWTIKHLSLAGGKSDKGKAMIWHPKHSVMRLRLRRSEQDASRWGYLGWREGNYAGVLQQQRCAAATVVRGVTAAPWHVSPLLSPSLIVARPWLWPCSASAHACCEQEIVDDQFQPRVCCGGEQHMVRHDLRANTYAPWYAIPPPHPPLTNTQTSIYINYHVLCCCGYFWWISNVTHRSTV